MQLLVHRDLLAMLVERNASAAEFGLMDTRGVAWAARSTGGDEQHV